MLKKSAYIIFIILFFSINVFAENEFHLLTVSGIIDAAIADYIVKSIENAEKEGATGVIIQMDTPGGLMKSMRTIIDKILVSKVAVITFVAPKGARAASAGTFILLASHIAAMAEGTNIGTASPIDFTGNKASEKITNDSIAYIKNLARLKNKNQQWAEDAIKKNVSSSEIEALKQNVIDIIAKDVDDLLNKINKKQIEIDNKKIKINTENYKIKKIEPSAKHKFLHSLTDPNISYILFLIGIYGIIYELAHPGAFLPGVVGAISLVLAFIGFDSIPINAAGIILIILSVIFFIAEAMTPTFGAWTIGGVISLILGSLLLFPSRKIDSVWAPSYFIIFFMVALTVIIIGIILVAIIKAHRKKVVVGKESLVGLKGVATTDIFDSGVANIGGEDWQAYSDEKISVRDIVEVIEVNGMKLKVKKVERKKEV
jgi:membrane-bound serine protease (ClpP class)